MKPFVQHVIGDIVERMKRRTKPIRPSPPPPPPESVLAGFPRTWIYYQCAGSGLNVMTAPGVFDTAYLDGLAKRNLVTLNIAPFTDTGSPQNLGIVSELRARNPKIIVLWYYGVQWVFAATSPAGRMWVDNWSLLTGPPDIRLYRLNNSDFFPGPSTKVWWDIGYAGKATAAANLWKAYGQGKADGFFFDTITGALTYGGGALQPPDPLSVNFVRAGYATSALLDASGKAGTESFIAQMIGAGLTWANRGGNVGNVTDAATRTMNGEMLELWDPGQGLDSSSPPAFFGGFNFDDCMTLCLSWQGAAPTGDGSILLKTEMGNTTVGNNAWNKACRYTLGCATVAGGMGHIGKGSDGRHLTDAIDTWADEYAVTPAGVADPTGLLANRGWLGRPIALGYKDSTSGMYVRRFDRGIVVVNGPSAPRSITLEKQYKRIQGVMDTTVNNGALVTNLTVPAKDARFLLNP
jgi:hypothetical protein